MALLKGIREFGEAENAREVRATAYMLSKVVDEYRQKGDEALEFVDEQEIEKAKQSATAGKNKSNVSEKIRNDKDDKIKKDR